MKPKSSSKLYVYGWQCILLNPICPGGFSACLVGKCAHLNMAEVVVGRCADLHNSLTPQSAQIVHICRPNKLCEA